MSDYPISPELLQTQHLAILATTGAGKSYSTRGIAEQMRALDWRHGIVDKLGNYWGLTISADGDSPGLEYVIFGGKHAHVDMKPQDGEKIAALFLEHDIPAIFDLSRWKKRDQDLWVSDFSDYVFLHNHGSLHLIIDEVQSWVPQGKGPECYESVLRLFSQGRGQGIKIIATSQRPAVFAKDALYMCTAIVGMKVTGQIDKKAVSDMFEPYVENVKDIKNGLPGLKTGQGYLYDPTTDEVAQIQFPLNATFDSSATPRHGDKGPTAKPMSSAIVDQIRGALAEPEPEAPISPVTATRGPETSPAEYAMLRAEIEGMEARIVTLTLERDQARADSLALANVRRNIQLLGTKLQSAAAEVAAMLKGLNAVSIDPEKARGKSASLIAVDELDRAPAPTVVRGHVKVAVNPNATFREDDGESGGITESASVPLTPLARKMLEALGRNFPRKYDIADLAKVSGVSMKSSIWGQNLRSFEASGFAVLEDGLWTLTANGIAGFAKTGSAASSSEAPLDAWCAQFVPATQRMLRFLVENDHSIWTKEQIADHCDISRTSSGLPAGLNDLVKQGLIRRIHHGYKVARDLK